MMPSRVQQGVWMSRGRIRVNQQKSGFLTLLALLTTMTGSTIACRRAESAIATWRSSQFIAAIQNAPTQPTRIRGDRLAVHVRQNQKQNYKNKVGSLPDQTRSYAQLEQGRVQAGASHQNLGVSLPVLIDLIRLLTILGVILLSFALWFWALLECAMTESSTSRTRLIWMLIILFAHAIGALVYLIVRRPRRIRTLGR